MPLRAVGDLLGGEKMDKPVAQIVGGAAIDAGTPRRLPCFGRAHVIDHAVHRPRVSHACAGLPVWRPGGSAGARVDTVPDSALERVLAPPWPAPAAGFREPLYL